MSIKALPQLCLELPVSQLWRRRLSNPLAPLLLPPRGFQTFNTPSLICLLIPDLLCTVFKQSQSK